MSSANPRSPVPAATVLLLRDGPRGSSADDAALRNRQLCARCLCVPGGGIDALDAAAHAQASGAGHGQSDLHLTQAIAAIRESFEELGVLLARHA
jgi:recombination protein RecT